MTNSSKTFKLIIEFELTGSELEFVVSQEFGDSFLALINQAMSAQSSSFRSARCVKIKRVLTHADVQLPMESLKVEMEMFTVKP